MNRLAAGGLRRGKDLVGVEIGLLRLRLADMHTASSAS